MKHAQVGYITQDCGFKMTNGYCLKGQCHLLIKELWDR